MTTHSGWCLTRSCDNCRYSLCGCPCHKGEPTPPVPGQTELIPDERTTTEVPF